jgi:predicted outer membrane lipoprotein
MSRQRPAQLRPWMPFTLPAAIALPIVTGFLFAGPLLGLAVAALVAVAIVFVAIRMGTEPRPRDPDAPAVRRAAARRFVAPLVIAATAIVVIVAAEGAVQLIGWGLLAAAFAVATSLVFLEVGYSEDRARDRERRAAPRRRRRDTRPGLHG